MFRTLTVFGLLLLLAACGSSSPQPTGTVLVYVDPPEAATVAMFALPRTGAEPGEGVWGKSASCSSTGIECDGSPLILQLEPGVHNISISAGNSRPQRDWVSVNPSPNSSPYGQYYAIVTVIARETTAVTGYFRPANTLNTPRFGVRTNERAMLYIREVTAETPFTAIEVTARCNQANTPNLWTTLTGGPFELTDAPLDLYLSYSSGFSYFSRLDVTRCSFDGIDQDGHAIRISFPG